MHATPVISTGDEAASRMPPISGLPASLAYELKGDVAVLRLARPQKRNALDTETILGIERFFSTLPDTVKAVVLHGEGKHFCAGLDLNEVGNRSTAEAVELARRWHRAFEAIEFGKVPVVAVLHGAVIGGGLELAAAAHIRVAERSAFYALPEASRGIFLGGGGSVRLPRLIGLTRVLDMMLTGRTYGADEGRSIGFSQYVADDREGLAKGLEIASRVAANGSLVNFALTHVLPRIAEQDHDGGLLTEALALATVQADADAASRIRNFLSKAAPKIQRDQS